MEKIKIDKSITDAEIIIDNLLIMLNDLDSYSLNLQNKINAVNWFGNAKEKYTALSKLTIKYQDDIRYLYESIQVHIKELIKDIEYFESDSEIMNRLRS